VNRSSVSQAYATLGLHPGCSWEEVRQQYKRLAFTWHPDRHIATPDPGAIEERAKEINAAFDVLSSYYRARERAREYPPQGHSPPEQPATSEQPYAPEKSHAPAMHSTGAYVLAAVGIVAMAFWILARLAIEPDAESAAGSHAGIPMLSDDARHPEPPSGTMAGDFGGLRVGANTQEVLRAVGVPAQIAGDEWRYDAGRVFFRNGVVTHWQVAAGSSPGGSLSPVGVDERVTYGSTRADVRRILGAPAAEGDTQWTYGPSQIYFEDGRVSGWYISPLQPLKVTER